jgi:hypothetical protein
VLTVASFLLLTPPLLDIFDRPVLVLGIPLLYVYCYGVWTAAIVCAARLATCLTTPRGNAAGDTSRDTGSTERG